MKNSASPTNPFSATHPFAGAAGNTACEIQFTITNGSKLGFSALMVVSTVNNPLNLPLNNYVHLNPRDYTKADLENANKGQPQIVQLGSLTAGNSVFIKVIIFDTSFNFSWTITVN